MKTFEEIKSDFVEKCKAASACEPEFKKLLKSNNELELLQVVTDNINWCYRQEKIIDIEFFKQFKPEILEQAGIIISGFREVRNLKILALGNSTVKAWDNSTVKAWGNSTVEAWGNSTVEAWDNSTVEAWGNSTVKALGNSTVEAWDNSTVEAWGNSTLYSQNSTDKHKIGNRGIMRKEGKLYIKKGAFEIIEIE